jgi:hypothetical protein
MTQEETTVLLAALNERYQSLRVIRSRVQDICIWTVGLLLGAAGWIIAKDHPLTLEAKLTFIVGVGFALFLVCGLYLRDLEAGFRKQQEVTAGIEAALGYFTTGNFNSAASVYPSEWASAGKPMGKGNYFASSFSMIYWAAGFLVVVVLAKGSWF